MSSCSPYTDGEKVTENYNKQNSEQSKLNQVIHVPRVPMVKRSQKIIINKTLKWSKLNQVIHVPHVQILKSSQKIIINKSLNRSKVDQVMLPCVFIIMHGLGLEAFVTVYIASRVLFSVLLIPAADTGVMTSESLWLNTVSLTHTSDSAQATDVLQCK